MGTYKMIIVTGGAGFIGSAIIAALNKRQISDILVVDELACSQKWKNLRNLSFADYVQKDDFLEMVVENKLTGPIKAVFHLGCDYDADVSFTEYLQPLDHVGSTEHKGFDACFSQFV